MVSQNEQEIEDILHSNEYNDRYDPLNQYSMMLWRPDSAIMQEDLNSLQSYFHNQFKLIGNYSIGNGTILSGMHLVVNSTKNNTPKLPNISEYEKNILSSNDISAINSNINRSQYTKSGTVDVAPESENTNSYPGIELYLTSKDNIKEFTVSFGVQCESGNLHSVGFAYTGNGSIKNELVDGNDISKLPSNANLNDGKTHVIQATFDITGSLQPLYILINQGLDVTQAINTARVSISSLMVNKGDSAAPWRLSMNDTNLPSQNRNQTVSITPGTIYLDGYARQFGNIQTGEGQQINITGSGTENIGVELTKNLVRAQPINPNGAGYDLYDTTKGASSQGERLADRIQYNVSLTYNDDNAPTIYTLVNGHLYKNNSSTGNTHLDALLAKRTYDQSGSFRVSGLSFYTKADPSDSNYGYLVINKGTAYVMGYGVYLEEPTTIRYKIPKEMSETNDEDVIQNTGYRHSWVSMPLQYQPIVKNSLYVVGSVQVGGTNLIDPEHNDNDYPRKDNKPARIDNHLLFGTGDMGRLPNVFQPTHDKQHGYVGGGFNGPLTVFNGHYDEKQQKFIINGAVTLDPDTQNTYVKIANQHSYEDYSNGEVNTSIKMYNPKNTNDPATYYEQGSGISVEKINDQWEVAFDFSESEQEAIFGDIDGDTFYVQGAARHEFTGPDSGVSNPDYRVISSNNPDGTKNYNALNNARLQFGGKNESGIVPKIGCDDLEASYKYYLAQVDTLTLDKNGDFHLIAGVPTPLPDARPREQSNPNTLRIGYVVLLPDTFASNCQFSSVTRIPFAGLQDLSARVRNLELMEQNNVLNNQAMNYTDPQKINNTINDDFTTFSTGDYTIDPINVALDLAHGKLSVEDYGNSIEPIYPKVDPSDNSYTTSQHLLMANIHNEYRQEWQNAVTGSITLNNERLANGSTNGLLSITPNADSFISCNGYTFLLDGIPTSVQLHNWFTYDESLFPKQSPKGNLWSSHSFGEDYDTRNLSQWSMRKETGEQTSEAGNEYIHPRRIHFATNWAIPNANGYYIKINDQYDPSWSMDLKAENGTQFDPTSKTLTADKHGNISGSFILPDNLPTGAKKITLTNIITPLGKDDKAGIDRHIGDVKASDTEATSFSAIYKANGIINDDIGTVSNSYNASDQYNNEILPNIGQSVLIRQDSTLTKVELTFNNKPIQNDSSANVLVQLRTVNADDTPTDNVLAQSTMPSSQIRVDGLPTAFRFDDPVFVNKGDRIAITVYSPSEEYSIDTSNIPMNIAQDITYSNQDMYFTTSNGTQWNTPTNNESLMFTLYRASFDTNTQITFKPDDLTKDYSGKFNTISKLALLANYITPDNSSLDWTIKLGYIDNNSDQTEYTILPLNNRRTLQLITDDITDSGEDSNKYNQVVSLQLTCNMTWDNEDTNSNDEIANQDKKYTNDTGKSFSRVSPMINIGTIAFAIAESKFNNTDENHLDVSSYLTYQNNTKEINVYNPKIDGLYISKNLMTFAPNYNTVITTFDVSNDDGFTNVIPTYSPDGGSNWYLYDTQKEYQNYPKIVPVDSNFSRYTYKTKINSDNDTDDRGDFKMGLLLLSTSPYHQPIVRRLTNTLTLENGYNTDNAQPYVNNNSSTNWLNWND